MSAIKTIEATLIEYKVTVEQVEAVELKRCGASVQSAHTSEKYDVSYNSKFRKLTCTCLAGKAGSSCWHRRAALAALAILNIQELEIEQALASRSDEEIAEQSQIARLVGSGMGSDEAIRQVYAGGNTYDPSVRRDSEGRILR